MRVAVLAVVGALLALSAQAQDEPAVRSAASAPYIQFESGHVESLLLSEDGRTLYALNTPDHRVEVYAVVSDVGARKGTKGRQVSLGSSSPSISGGATPPEGLGGVPMPTSPAPRVQLRHDRSIFVGLEPVSMALSDDGATLFVSNHLSDTVSVVDLTVGFTVATIPVGDEPQGLTVVGDRLFVACARTPTVPTPPGEPDRGDTTHHVLVVAQSVAPYALIDHVPLGAIKPRDVVAVDGTVYVVPQNSGNRTTLIDETDTKTTLGWTQLTLVGAEQPFAFNPVLAKSELSFPAYARGWPIPVAGRIVLDSDFPTFAPQLLDHDVLSVDAATLAVSVSPTTGVGTTLFDVELNPFTGDLWVAATDARNLTRFEPELRGVALDNRVTIVEPGAGVRDVISLEAPTTQGLHAQPTQIEFGSEGDEPRAYVTALGSASLVVLDGVTGDVVREVDLAGTLPTGLAFDDARGLLYVLTRGDSGIRALAVEHGDRVVTRTKLAFDPEPLAVTRGREHLYDARASSGHGNGSMSCASCHVFGHFDQMAWDLGDPEGGLSYYYPDVMVGLGGYPGELVVAPTTPALNPLKGPMVTQSLRGLIDPDTKDDSPMHWRGDRRTFHTFRGAFGSLLGGSGITPQEMQEFTTYLRTLRYGPNPMQPLDREYRGLAALGEDTYGMDPNVAPKSYGVGTEIFCIQCHVGDFSNGTDFTGSRPTVSAGSFTQLFNTSQLRYIYEKDFRFITGFGALHDGAVDGVRGFMDFHVPNGGMPTFGNFNTADKDAVATFVKQWDTGLSPLIGSQVTLRVDTVSDVSAHLDLAEPFARTTPPALDIIIRGYREDVDGTPLARGAVYTFDDATGLWGYLFDTGTFVERSLLEQVAELDIAWFTFTAVPAGMGRRLGIDRDEDGLFDNLERLVGTALTNPDTDGDGYLDGDELLRDGNPLVAEVALAGGAAPVLLAHSAEEIFHSTATLALVVDEPVDVRIDLGLTVGDASLGSTTSAPGLARRHDIVLTGLPAGTLVHYRATVTDRDEIETFVDGTFTTLPPFFHVSDITLTASASAPYDVVATVSVRDHLDQPVDNVNVHVFWEGDLAGQEWQQDAKTDPSGVATFALDPLSPSGPTTLSVSPTWIGSAGPLKPDFVGVGGDTPVHYYDQPSNTVNYRSIALP